jgi:hypothetical protein
VSFGEVSRLLSDASFLHVIQVMARTGLLSGADQHPCVLLVSDKDLFYGGILGGREFKRIRRGTISSARRVGKSFLTAVRVCYTHEGDARSVYLCPFTGHPSLPEIDLEALSELERLLEDGRSD